MTALTIAVPTMPGRESLLSRCLWSIQTQQHTDTVQVLVVDGNAPQGDKLNAAAAAAHGEYFTAVDDDDLLDGCYLREMLPRLTGVDFVGIKALCMVEGKFLWIAECRGDRITGEFATRRWGPSPKGALRTAIWRVTPFGNAYRSDRQWHPKVESYDFVDHPVYIYDSWPGIGYGGGGRDVGEWPVDWDRVDRITVGREVAA